ncbi:hypothetical protein C1N73_32605 (plasmid) [Priestia aryabhattai]
MSYSYILENFKAISSSQKVPIKPITLIFGANSSGKSSLIHSLLLANEAINTGELDISKTKVGGESVDIGGFQQYVYGRDINRNVKWGIEYNVDGLSKRLKQIFEGVNKVKVEVVFGMKNSLDLNYLGRPSLLEYIIYTDGEELIKLTRNKKGKLNFKDIFIENSVIDKILESIILQNTTTTRVGSDDIDALHPYVKKLRKELNIKEGLFLPVGLLLNDSGQENRLFYPISKGDRAADLSNAIKLFLPWIIHEIIRGINKTIEDEINKLQYLGPLRSYPPRHFTISGQMDADWIASGGYTWEILRKDSQVREKVNTWLSSENRLKTPYQLMVRDLIDMQQLSEYLYNEFIDIEQSPNKDLNIFKGKLKNFNKFDFSGIKRLKELILLDKRSNKIVSHRDVGIGISQIIPVLVSSFSSSNKVVAIEQPELHLHPALQAEMADVFIESALGKGKNTFILETHSEHLILRVMRRIRETSANRIPENLPPITPNDVSILFVEPIDNNKESVVRVLELDQDGELLDPWPGGFFEEGFRERFS